MNLPLAQHQQIKIVSTFKALAENTFTGDQNAVCWERKLEGDFEEVVSKLTLKENVTEIEAKDLAALQLSEQGDLARKNILKDLQLLTDIGAAPTLNLLKHYERDDVLDFISTDVYSFHADHSPIEASTFLCTYYGAASDLLPNNEAVQKVTIPAIRQQLQKLHEGKDEEFEVFLNDHYFDLHYEAQPHAQPINLGQGHLWRLAVASPAQKVLPCIHRAPVENEGELRLLLIC